MFIRDGELIVGCKTPAILGSPLYPEVACDWIDEELDTMAGRDYAPFYVSEETKEMLRSQVVDYWRGRQVYNRIMEVLPQEVVQATDEGLFFHYYKNRTIGHITVDYERVIKKGSWGSRPRLRPNSTRLTWRCGLKKHYLLQAMCSGCDAAIHFAERYAERQHAWLRRRGTRTAGPNWKRLRRSAVACPPIRPAAFARRCSRSGLCT